MAAPAAQADAARGNGVAAGGASVKLLLIEDDQETADYVMRGLREQGHVVDHAANGRDGLFRAGDGPYDVLIVAI